MSVVGDALGEDFNDSTDGGNPDLSGESASQC